MSILIVSTNPLFKEVIIETVVRCRTEFIELNPEEAQTRICELKPDVIIIDELIAPPYFENLMAEVRSLQKTRTIVLNPVKNEIILMDSRRATLRKADDLMEAISSYGDRFHSEIKESDCSDSIEAAYYFASVIAFLASAFNKPPDANLVKRLRIIGVDAFIGRLNRVLGWSDEISCDARMISDFFETTAGLSEQQAAQILDADWADLFGTNRNANHPAPYEALSLETEADPLELIGRLSVEYAQGGADFSDEEGVRLDSIGTELSYLSCLAEQAATARERGEHELARSLEGRARTFNQDHLGRWAGKYLSEVLEYAQTSYFKGIILLSSRVISWLGEIGPASQLF